VANGKNSTQKIGIPSALTYYIHELDWTRFFSYLGYETVVSDKSSYDTFKQGFNFAANDHCLPIKTFFGHIIELKDQVDYLFIPQLVSLEKNTFSCPHILGAHLLIKNMQLKLPPVFSTEIDVNYPKLTLLKSVVLAMKFSKNPFKVFKAVNYIRKNIQSLFGEQSQQQDIFSGVVDKTIGVIGRNYMLNDPFLNKNLVENIKKYGFNVMTSEAFIHSAERETHHFNCRPVHWYSGRTMVTAAANFMKNPQIEGVIFVNFFGCGIDAFIEEIFKKELSEQKPYLNISFDEHSGEAGMMTRLEAFIDMIKRKRKALV